MITLCMITNSAIKIHGADQSSLGVYCRKKGVGLPAVSESMMMAFAYPVEKMKLLILR